ncbi:MAG: DUF3592 domain-containing protein [Verrucomicrobiota bacterium]
MTSPVLHPRFRITIGVVLVALGLLGATSLATKEIPLALFGEHSTGLVRKVETITSSSGSKRNLNGKSESRSSTSYIMHLAFTTKDGKPTEFKTTATFRTEARVGDEHPIVYLPFKPERAKIYSAKQLWLPMCVGFVFTGVCLFFGLRFVRRRDA